MKNLCIALAVVLSCVALGAWAYSPDHDILQHHSLLPPFVHDFWQEGLPHWDIGGDAIVTENFIRLTPSFSSRYGWLWNSQPNDNQWWEMRAKFRIFSKQGLGADGMAIWYAENPYKEEQVGPLMGMERTFKGIGILFDTYDNDARRDNPATSLITNLHGETTTWDMESDLLHQSAFRCKFDHRNTAPNDPVEVILTYQYNKLTLRLRSHLRALDVLCGEVDNIELPLHYHFGVTASTGHLVDNHDLYGFTVKGLGGDNEHANTKVEHFNHDEEAGEKDQWKAQ